MKTKILLIDDDPGIRHIYGKLLSDEGYDVSLLRDAKFAFETLFVFKPDLILLDINLPDFGGEMLFGLIRNYDTHPKIIISSVYPVIQQKKCIPDADDYFDKAQGMDFFLEMIRKNLTLHQKPFSKTAQIHSNKGE